MKPHVICLMVSSVDGRTLNSRWRPKRPGGELFEHCAGRAHETVRVGVPRIAQRHLAGRDTRAVETARRRSRTGLRISS